MGLLIISIIIFIISSIVIIYMNLKDIISDWIIIFYTFAVFSILSVTIGLIPLMDIQNKFNQIVYEYEMQQEVLDNTREHNSSYEVFQITPVIFNTNKTIAKHRAYHNNWWVGIYYSEKVGNLKPLK